MDKHYLTPLLAPRSILVFAGPPDDTAAQTPFARQIHGHFAAIPFNGTVQVVDTGGTSTLADLAHTRADLALLALPAGQLAEALTLAGRMTCRSALILANGIDAELARELAQIAARFGMQLLGPNSLGFQRPSLQLNASVLGPLAGAGPLALVSQSGALTAAMLDWAARNAVGFSSIVAVGRNSAVDLADVLDFLANDGRTQSILVYMEGIANARRFMSALRSAANAKPVVVLKAGRQPAGNRAAQTHSGTSVGSDDVFDSALRRAGAVRVRSFVELFSAAKCLASRYRPVGPRLAIVTNGGGPGVLAADWVNELDLHLAALSAETVAGLKAALLPEASLSDLIDLSEEASPEHYVAAILAANGDAAVDGVLALHSPKPGVDPNRIARAVVALRPHLNKPLLTCWMGDTTVQQARVLLNEGNLPTFRTPESAVGAFGNIASFYRNQRLLQQTPTPLSALASPDLDGARLVIGSVLAERRDALTEMESKTLLSAFHIPVTHTVLARSANEAMMIATQMGFPVALKIDSPDITHKSDVQGVALNLLNGTAVRDMWTLMIDRVRLQMPEATIHGVTVQKMARAQRGREVCIGLVRDDPFGPVITFGAGGVMIELINDRAMELPPLNQFLARRLIERARVAVTLEEWRGAPPVDFEALEQILLRVSEMVCELPQLREMDINPIIVDADGAVAVDARIVVDTAAGVASGLDTHYSHLAILPYPGRYEQRVPMRGGGEYVIRPIHPDDAQMLQELVAGLSPESRYMRFASTITELPAAMLARLTLIDYDREMALVAVHQERNTAGNGPALDAPRIIGVSRYISNPDRTSGEFSLLVADSFSGLGLGSRLMESIMQVARDKGLVQLEGLVLANNPAMLKLMHALGFTVKPFEEDPDFMLATHQL